ncbi:MAG TPA: hypothetical protein VGU73_03575 [Acidimicrobiia bacterium]|nr:hypothetical protein [Acidimicrobiia bacterium]
MGISRLGHRSRDPHDSLPRHWETSQSVAADLHRRMHAAIARTRATLADARRCGVPIDHFESLCDELDSAAGIMDEQLMAAARLPLRVRHRTLLDLRYHIVDLERTGDRIGRSALDAAAPVAGGFDETLRHINERLDRHAEARRELRELGP